MADSARKTHVSPGVYSREIDLNFAVKSLGLTTLGVAGETVKGPAFQPMEVTDWAHFKDLFGGTNTEKFKGSQYPKYELPYIAKSYLTESQQLLVCRVLGLSGYNAGPAWAITAKKGTKHMVIAVIRSRGYYREYEKYDATEDDCVCGLAAYDKLHYHVGALPHVAECLYATHYNPSALTINSYVPLTSEAECLGNSIDQAATTWKVSATNYGRFTLSGFVGEGVYGSQSPIVDDETKYFRYPVSLNPNDNDYILKVLGTDPQNGEAPIYVESLYDVAHIQGIMANEITEIDSSLTFYDVCFNADVATIPQVDDFIMKEEGALKKSDLGKRFLCAKDFNGVTTTYHKYAAEGINTICADSGKTDIQTGVWTPDSGQTMDEGAVYTVKSFLDPTGKRRYYYAHIFSGDTSLGDYLVVNTSWTTNAPVLSGNGITSKRDSANRVNNKSYAVVNKADGATYVMTSNNKVAKVTCDLNDYKSAYRYASTPWIVSNVKGDYNHIELSKLFRFHTISDGDNANKEVKISITNILPDEGLFTIQVRAIDDTDASPIVLESFSKCSLVPGDKNYVAYKVGSYDGVYESKSRYITVEVNENMTTRNSVPAGFLGYPIQQFGGTPIIGEAKQGLMDNIVPPSLKYNTSYDEEIKNRKQYFGLSDLVGVDVDMFTFKGNVAYSNETPENLTNGFHLDCRLDAQSYGTEHTMSMTVDGVSGYVFDTVSVNSTTETLEGMPIIDKEVNMDGSIFENVNLRKFTVYLYGGFDGWDVYRDERTITDNYMLSRYQGHYNDFTGEGFSFNKIQNPELLGLNQKAITSDWYAYLAAIRQFANPVETDINVLATPGIDYVNNQKLVEEVIEMVEEERADSIYVVTTPDKPKGALDYVDEMFDADEVVENLEYSEIDSNYTCTYFPWVKYEDIENNQYIYLPATKDAVRNMAMTDNIAHPWFAPAGLERGNVDCVRAHKITKLADEDTLYDGRINPVKTFAQDGVKLWGQKNLQVAETQLNRIAVRRLLLRMRKLVAVACLSLIFEPNDATTKDKFLSIVTPILDNIRANRGISDYKIEVDDSIEARERYELPAKLFFKPYKALEYVTLDFILTPEGVSFSDI